MFVTLGLEPLAHLEHVAVALGREEADPGALALDEGVGRDGHAVHDRLGAVEEVGKRRPERLGESGERLQNPDGLVGRGARGLREHHPSVLIDRDHVRERAAHVHPDPVPGS